MYHRGWRKARKLRELAAPWEALSWGPESKSGSLKPCGTPVLGNTMASSGLW